MGAAQYHISSSTATLFPHNSTPPPPKRQPSKQASMYSIEVSYPIKEVIIVPMVVRKKTTSAILQFAADTKVYKEFNQKSRYVAAKHKGRWTATDFDIHGVTRRVNQVNSNFEFGHAKDAKKFIKAMVEAIPGVVIPWAQTRDQLLFSRDKRMPVTKPLSCTEKKLVKTLVTSLNAKCAKCGLQNVKFKKCSGCIASRYCSVDCQRADWKEHKPICKSLSKQ
jgi:hypothetical protein